jgi:hypothetical protein
MIPAKTATRIIRFFVTMSCFYIPLFSAPES